MRVKEVLPAASKRLVVIRDDASLTDAAKLLREPDVDLVVACGEDKSVTGVITKTDLVREISERRGGETATTVSSVMTRDVASCGPHDSLHDVWTMMKERKLKNVPVLDQDSRPIGVLNARDLLESLLEEVEHEETLLRDYVMSIGHPRI